MLFKISTSFLSSPSQPHYIKTTFIIILTLPLPLLMILSAPRKVRAKYGKRRLLSEEERVEQARSRNREHAKSTRQRRKVFEAVLCEQLEVLRREVQGRLRLLGLDLDLQRAVHTRHSRMATLKSFALR